MRRIQGKQLKERLNSSLGQEISMNNSHKGTKNTEREHREIKLETVPKLYDLLFN